MIIIVKTPRSQMGSPAAAEEGEEVMGGGRGESGESSEVHERDRKVYYKTTTNGGKR